MARQHVDPTVHGNASLKPIAKLEQHKKTDSITAQVAGHLEDRGVQPPPLNSIGPATARISNIEISTTEGELVTYLNSKGLSLSEDHGKITFITSEAGYKLVSVSFFDEETFKRALSLPRVDRKLKGRTLNFDGGFEGFTIFSNGTEVDIVALHGMNGHAFNSWEYRDNAGYSFMWLRDALPARIPTARIMVYGYNANLVSDVSTGRIRSFADTFLEGVLRMRRTNQVTDRPLILLGHSLGGLIIKQALIIANTRADGRFDSILNSIGGIVFLGTPHRGLNGIDTGTFISNFVGASRGNLAIRNDLVAEQHRDSSVLFDLTDDFRQLIAAKDIDIATLFELKKTQCEGSEPIWIVDEQSAVLGVAGERKTSINATHINMCKFEDAEDNSLGTTIEYIEEFIGDVVPRISSKQLSTLPSPPEGLKYTSLTDPEKLDMSDSYPILELGKLWYCALSYIDNRCAMTILAFDKSGRIKGRWSKSGARYVHRIECLEREGYRQVSFVGQGNLAIVFHLAELSVAGTM